MNTTAKSTSSKSSKQTQITANTAPRAKEFNSSKTHFGRKHIDMLRALIAFALSAPNVAITKSIVAFENVINALKSNLDAIDSLLAIASNPVTGYAQQKLYAKKVLAEYSAALMQSVKAYAISINNKELYNKINTAPSKLTSMEYGKLVAYIRGSIDIIKELLPQLQNYNITEESIELWESNLATLNNLLASPKNEHGYQDNTKKDIQRLLRASMAMLALQADQIAQQFKASSPMYFDNYKYNRKLRPLTRHTKFRVTVTNDLEQPVTDAVITQDGTTNSIITDINGQANLDLQMVKAGEQPIYSFTISKGSKSTNSGLIEIKRGETISRSYQIAQDGFIIPEHQPQQAQKAYVKR